MGNKPIFNEEYYRNTITQFLEDKSAFHKFELWTTTITPIMEKLFPPAEVPAEEPVMSSRQYACGEPLFGDTGLEGATFLEGDSCTADGIKQMKTAAEELLAAKNMKGVQVYAGIITSPPWGLEDVKKSRYAFMPDPGTDVALDPGQIKFFFENAKKLLEAVNGEVTGFVVLHLPFWLIETYGRAAERNGFRILTKDGGPWTVTSVTKPNFDPLSNLTIPVSQTEFFLVLDIGVRC